MNNQILSIDVEVYNEDVDGYGIVHHTSYLRFLERARHEWFKAIVKDDYKKITQKYYFPIHKIDIHYMKPSFLDDKLIITTQPIKYGSCSILFEQFITKSNRDMICKAQVKVGCVDRTFNIIKLPLEVIG